MDSSHQEDDLLDQQDTDKDLFYLVFPSLVCFLLAAVYLLSRDVTESIATPGESREHNRESVLAKWIQDYKCSICSDVFIDVSLILFPVKTR